jgi:hypothetical protein
MSSLSYPVGGAPTLVPIGVNGWKVKDGPPTWCGYGYLFTGTGASNGYEMLPFKAIYVAKDAFQVVASSTCFTGMVPAS